MMGRDALIHRLEEALGPAGVSAAGDRLTVFPDSEARLADIVRLCRESRTPVVPVGAGTLMDVGGPPPPDSLFVGLSRFDGLVEHDDANLTVTIGAGMVVGALQQSLAARVQFVALDPPWPERATVGGVVSANLNGFRRAGYRSIRDLVIGMRVVTGKGEIVKTGGKVVKNVAGYDMGKLFIGSLGTLGIITEVTARVEPRPETDVTLVLSGNPSGIFPTAEAVAASPILPTAVVVCNGAAAAALHLAPEAAALVRLEGFAAALPRQEREVRARGGGEVRRIDGAAHQELWAALARLGWEGGGSLVRLMVPRRRLGEVWEELSRRPLPATVLADIQSGTIWIAVDAGAPAETVTSLAALATRAGGHFLIARLPPGMAEVPRWGPAPPAIDLMRAMKRTFDPDGILSPGRFIV